MERSIPVIFKINNNKETKRFLDISYLNKTLFADEDRKRQDL